jgi:hypothetical protein
LQENPGSNHDATVFPAIVPLPLEEKGFVLFALLARVPPAAVAARLDETVGARCGAVVAALAEAPKADRAAAIAALLALVRAPVPAGIERIHPGWLRERLTREPSDIVRAVTAGLSSEIVRLGTELLAERGEGPGPDAPARAYAPAGVAELQRIVFAGFVPLAGPGAPSGPAARRLLALTVRALEEAIEMRGAETLGVSLRGAPGPIVAQAAAAIGDRLAGLVVRAAARDGTPGARDEARGLVASTGAHAPRETAWELGCRALGVDMRDEGPGAMVAVAERLAPARGRRLLDAAGVETAL